MTLNKRGSRTPSFFVVALATVIFAFMATVYAYAAPQAALVMDARSGKVLYAQNADQRLHPASLTKMMTLYIAFEAIKNGEIGVNSMVKISQHAANEVPSKLGLRAGSSIEFRFLIRAAAIKSANDAATAIGEAISGSEAAFARRMNRTAKALGMTRTTFKNAHGLTESGHLSTARDMTILGRRLFYDFPEYYNLFSRISTDAKLAEVHNTNRRFLSNYKGADGIKTGYTRAAGFNLTASAERGRERVIATVFGGASVADRNARMAELMDLGFQKAPTFVAVNRPSPPRYEAPAAQIARDTHRPAAGKTIRVAGAVTKSLRPLARPTVAGTEVAVTRKAAIQTGIAAAVAQLPEAKPRIQFTSRDSDTQQDPPADPVVVTRIATSGGRHWGINVGRYRTRFAAERMLLKTALAEMTALDGALRKVAENRRGFEANFVGMTQDQADLACRRLSARGVTCEAFGPG